MQLIQQRLVIKINPQLERVCGLSGLLNKSYLKQLRVTLRFFFRFCVMIRRSTIAIRHLKRVSYQSIDDERCKLINFLANGCLEDVALALSIVTDFVKQLTLLVCDRHRLPQQKYA
jgi:hypothetical protein